MAGRTTNTVIDARVIDKQEARLLAEDSTDEEEATQEGTGFDSKQLQEAYEEEQKHQKRSQFFIPCITKRFPSPR
jgi:hypothetical protein